MPRSPESIRQRHKTNDTSGRLGKTIQHLQTLLYVNSRNSSNSLQAAPSTPKDCMNLLLTEEMGLLRCGFRRALVMYRRILSNTLIGCGSPMPSMDSGYAALAPSARFCNNSLSVIKRMNSRLRIGERILKETIAEHEM